MPLNIHNKCLQEHQSVMASQVEVVAELTIPPHRSALLPLLLALVLLHLFFVTRTAPTPPIMASVLSWLENSVTFVASPVSGCLFSACSEAEHLGTRGRALTGSAVRVAAILSQIRASSTFRTLDHCGKS